jgi:hypothetical protein
MAHHATPALVPLEPCCPLFGLIDGHLGRGVAAMTESLTDGVTLGIYEKALVGNPLATDDDWRRFLIQVPEAGFSFDSVIAATPRPRWSAVVSRQLWDHQQRQLSDR